MALSRTTADPRVLFEAFLLLSRTATAAELRPLVQDMELMRWSAPAPETDFLFHVLAGVVGARARDPASFARLETALVLFDEHGLAGDPLFLECALLATLTLIRPHETRARFAAHVDRLDLDPGRRARLVAMIGLGDAWAGNLVRGQAEMLEARDLAARAGRLEIQAEVTSWLIKCEALRGDLAASAAHLAEARELAGRTGSAWVAGHIIEGSAALQFALGDTEAWVGLLELMVGAEQGVDSGLLFEYRWELATHHALRGESGTAAALLDGVPEAPVGLPGGPAMAAWRDWISAPDDAGLIAAFEGALKDLVRPDERLPRARMCWLLGVAHGRAGRRAPAVRLLEAACSGYATIGAAGMLALAAADLRAVTGSPPKDPWPLTGAEVRVAVAVADGLSNKEAAERLFVSVKTVEFHLGNIFRKLDVRNRTELARRRDRLG
ncbi:hypothetical protein AFR_03520 [Actinoplanes friuliensis DSM 7358]|uniref:HTH luxR-type domain-containing protein n=1 Tax=Actinoplanes friuliensis DSM 7358 TaxID=1246995 RepID=U5VPV7_9ACTN|nr:hypothetical protein AFR_03520 [Actinoplanes friuliensis DSM 7358]